jgi:aminoglycoside phosphotransferase (APT) family kinase protein
VTQPSPSDVRTAVADLLPDATVTDVSPIEAGKNAVYAVGLDGRETVLKVGTASPDRVRAEPAIVAFVGEHTAIPVPTVVGAADDGPLGHPCYLAERVPRRTVPDRPEDLSVSLLERICTEGGRHLAELHALDSFDGVGPLVTDDGDLHVADPDAEWPQLLSRAMAAKVDALGDRFEDRADALRGYAASVDEALAGAGPFASAFVHMDYRPANLVLAPAGSTVTRAVLDWAGAAAAPPAYEVAHAEALLSDWPHLDEGERARLRDRFRSGYGEGRAVPDVPDPYRVDAQLRLMKHLEIGVGERGDAVIRERVVHHERRLDALGAP